MKDWKSGKVDGRAALISPDGKQYVFKDEVPENPLDGLTFAPFGLDTGLEYPRNLGAGMVAAGDAFNSMGRGFRQLTDFSSDAELDAEAQEAARFMNPLREDHPISTFLGNVAPSVPLMFTPAAPAAWGQKAQLAGNLGSALTLSAGDNLLRHQENTSTGERTIEGAGYGLLGYGAASMAGRVIPAVKQAFTKAPLAKSRAARAVDDVGGRLTVGDAYDIKALKAWEDQARANPMMREYFETLTEDNARLMNEVAAEAIGLPPKLLNQTDGKLTPELIDLATSINDEVYREVYDAVGYVRLPDDLAKHFKQNADVKKLMGLNRFELFDAENILKTGEWRQLRSAVSKSAGNEKNTDVARAIYEEMINPLEDIVQNKLAETGNNELFQEFLRAKENYRNIMHVQKANVTIHDQVRPRGANTSLYKDYGASLTPNKSALLEGMQDIRSITNSTNNPETAKLLETAKALSNADVTPFKTSGTGERIIAADMQADVLNGLANQDAGALRRLVSQFGLGHAYKLIAETRPDVLAAAFKNPVPQAAKNAGAVLSSRANNEE